MTTQDHKMPDAFTQFMYDPKLALDAMPNLNRMLHHYTGCEQDAVVWMVSHGYAAMIALKEKIERDAQTVHPEDLDYMAMKYGGIEGVVPRTEPRARSEGDWIKVDPENPYLGYFAWLDDESDNLEPIVCGWPPAQKHSKCFKKGYYFPLPPRADQPFKEGWVMAMSVIHKKLARHALGLPNGQYRSYRNRFHVWPGCRNHADWMEMVECGLADTDGLDSFWLTRAGAEAALEGHETLCSEDFPEKKRGA
jgi:hypothetical protein